MGTPTLTLETVCHCCEESAEGGDCKDCGLFTCIDCFEAESRVRIPSYPEDYSCSVCTSDLERIRYREGAKL